MGSLGFSEILLILIIALVVFGPKKLPELSRTIGKALAEFRRASSELRSAMEEEMRELERHTREMDRQEAQPSLPPATEAAQVYDADLDSRGIGFAAGAPPAKSASTDASEKTLDTEVKPPDGESKPA